MDKHTLSEILKILPDDFTFKAVLDENSQSICLETQDKPHNMKQEAKSIKQDSNQTPLSQEAMLELKAQMANAKEQEQQEILATREELEEQELWEYMCDAQKWWWWGCEDTHYYDIKSKQWIDYTTYWSSRIKTKLESQGVFMSDVEFMRLVCLSHPLIASLNCEWWRDYSVPVLDLYGLYLELNDFIDKYATYEKAPNDFEGCTLTCSQNPQDK
nr:hypothetical protein [uncultured Helicobacter sp.]